jgi:hypothetical protein
MRFTSRFSIALFSISLVSSASSAVAQGPVARATAATGYVSMSGATTFGFAPSDAGKTPTEVVDVRTILPRGSDVPAIARPLVAKMWLKSPTFRRQCARLVEASVAIVLSLDYPRESVMANAETTIRRDAGLRAHIRMRSGDPRGAEYLAHEIEHILEQADDVDLPLAVAGGVHGAHLVSKPDMFETRRAIAVGKTVAREVASAEDRR